MAGQKGAELIALVLPNLGVGGAEIANVALATQFIAQGFRVDLVTLSLGPTPTVPVPLGARHIVLHSGRIRNFLLPFARYLRRERPDAAIVSMWPLTTTCLLAHRLVGSSARILIWEHGTLSDQYRGRGAIHRLTLKSSIALTYPLAHARVAVSSGVADDLAALSGVSREAISVVHNPLLKRPANSIDAQAVEAAWGWWRGPRVISVGRFKSEKNHALLIRAFKKVLAKRDARLLLVGSGELADATAALAREVGVADKVLMTGMVPDPTPFYLSSDLFVLSSNSEGLPTVILEALACGVPVVSTDCKSGPSEILENGRYGRLVPVGDQAALAQAIVECLSTAPDRDALRRRAADFAPERIAAQYLDLLFPNHA